MSIYWNLCCLIAGLALLTKINGTTSQQIDTMASMPTTKSSNRHQSHILNLVKQMKQNKMSAKQMTLNDRHLEFEEFARYENSMTKIPWHVLLGPPRASQRSQKMKATARITTDDLLDSNQNTLENTNADFNRLRNADSNSGFYLRFKQSIPVLEPVRHLLNTVREGGFNHTTHFNKTRHQLIGPDEVSGSGRKGGSNEVETSSASSAIETEAERDMVLHESTNFQVLDFLGSIGSMIWSLLMNFKKWFTAATANASAASSGASF